MLNRTSLKDNILSFSPKRRKFGQWLSAKKHVAHSISMPQLIAQSGMCVSVATAYRTAVALGVRGQRRNHTRYSIFWSRIDWRLPDMVLGRIWGVSRQNVRHRRKRDRRDAPRWRLPHAISDREYVNAIRQERKRAGRYSGPVPR